MQTVYFTWLFILGLLGVCVQVLIWLNMKGKHGFKDLPLYFKYYTIDFLIVVGLYTGFFFIWYSGALPWIAGLLASFFGEVWKARILKLGEALSGKPNAAIFFVGLATRTLYDWLRILIMKVSPKTPEAFKAPVNPVSTTPVA